MGTITIDFRGDPLLVIRDEDRGDLVPLRPLVVGMGLDWSAQYRRVSRHPILGPAVCMMQTTPVAMTATASDTMTVCLPLDLVPGFLFGVDASRVADDVRPKVLDYQRECFKVLADACLGRVRPSAGQTAEILPPQPIATPDLKLGVRLVTECRSTFGVQPARELWLRLGLPTVPAMMAGPRQGDLFTYRREA